MLFYFTNLAPKKCSRVDILRNWNVTLKSDGATDESIFKLNFTFVSVTWSWAWSSRKCDEVSQQIFPLFQQWGVGRGMSFRKDTVSGDIFLQFCFFPFLHRHFLAQHSRWDVRPWSSVSCLTSNKGCNRMQLAGSVSTPKKDNAHSQHCPAFFSHGAYEEKLFNSQDINFI